MEVKIFTEEEASNMFLNGDSSAYNSDNIIISKVNKSKSNYRGVWFSFNNNGYFLKASNCIVWEYKEFGINKDNNFIPCNDEISNYSNKLLMGELLKKVGIFNFEEFYK